MSDFGARLRDLRQAKGLSRIKLARRANVSPHSIEAWETDRVRTPGKENVTKLARALDTTPEELAGPEILAAWAEPPPPVPEGELTEAEEDQRERDEIICTLARDGYSQPQLAEEFGISRQRVSQILRDAGITADAPVMFERNEELVRLAREGWTVTDLSQKFGIGYRRCWQIFQQYGISPTKGKMGRPRVYTNEGVLRVLAEFLETGGETESEYARWKRSLPPREEPIPATRAIVDRFGGWRAAKRQAHAYRRRQEVAR